MMEIDYDNHVAVTREIYWVGLYDEQSHIHCNPYLLIDEDDVVLFDPGSIPHFPVIMRKIIDLVKPSDISLVVACHQDPDVCGNLPVLEDIVDRPDLKIAAHSNTIPFIKHYGIQSECYAVDRNDFTYTLSSGRILDFLFTPFLHSPGAIVTYDRKSKSLFSGDIFGALSQDWSLFAKNDYLAAIAAFHRRYMPATRIVRDCMERLEGLELERIVPQHGSILEGEQIGRAVTHLKTLPCGIDWHEE